MSKIELTLTLELFEEENLRISGAKICNIDSNFFVDSYTYTGGYNSEFEYTESQIDVLIDFCLSIDTDGSWILHFTRNLPVLNSKQMDKLFSVFLKHCPTQSHYGWEWYWFAEINAWRLSSEQIDKLIKGFLNSAPEYSGQPSYSQIKSFIQNYKICKYLTGRQKGRLRMAMSRVKKNKL